jgi:SAM-dependent methyltransferase
VPRFLASAEIFVLPSVRDPFGNVDGLPTVVPEAMASGLPVVASDIGGVNLLISHGYNGLLVPAGDVKALADAVESLLEDDAKRQAMGDAARRDVELKFNWENVVQEQLSIFERAVWVHRLPLRLGTLYRHKTLNLLGKRTHQGRILDVGCYDGYFLSSLEAPTRIGADPHPVSGAPGVQFVCADGCSLPFKSGRFDAVYALDVIEHIEDDVAFVREISRMISPGGKLFLTTPSKRIRISPPFLTDWVSLKWGHHLRPGYTKAELEQIFPRDLELDIQDLNAPGYRAWYLILRTLSPLFPKLVSSQIKKIAKRDINRRAGEHGFLLLEATKPNGMSIAGGGDN